MILSDLFESMTDESYHFTGVANGFNILSSERFNLSASHGTESEKNVQAKKTRYFMSVSRSKVGDYTMANAWNQGVVFNLNAEWFNARYITKPVDYWEGSLSRMKRHSESEDRVMSNKPIIDFSGQTKKVIRSCHILVTKDAYKDSRIVTNAVKLYILSKKKGIPVFVYDDLMKFATQKNPISVEPLLTSYNNIEKDPPYYRIPLNIKRRIKPWAELVNLDDYDKLQKESRSLLYNIGRGYSEMYIKDAIRSLEADVHNYRRQPEVTSKFDRLFKQMGTNDIDVFVRKVAKKWQEILEKRDAR